MPGNELMHGTRQPEEFARAVAELIEEDKRVRQAILQLVIDSLKIMTDY